MIQIKTIFKLHRFTLILIFIMILLGIPLIISENPEVRRLAMWLPFFVVIINTIVNYYQSKEVNTIISNLLSLPFIVLGFMWFETFAFTDYRSHLAIFGIPIAIMFLMIGIILLNKSK